VPQWVMGKELDESILMPTFAMIYFIFLSINALTYMSMMTIQQFFSIIFRMSEVFELEEYQFNREVDVDRNEV